MRRVRVYPCNLKMCTLSPDWSLAVFKQKDIPSLPGQTFNHDGFVYGKAHNTYLAHTVIPRLTYEYMARGGGFPSVHDLNGLSGF